MFGWLEERQWFLLGDLAGIGRGLTGGVSMASLLALAMVPLSAWVLWRTAFGLRMRSSGENPWAGESLGVNINRVRYQALVISGGLAGLGGGFLSIVSSSFYRQGQTAGRGFIGLATADLRQLDPERHPRRRLAVRLRPRASSSSPADRSLACSCSWH